MITKEQLKGARKAMDEAEQIADEVLRRSNEAKQNKINQWLFAVAPYADGGNSATLPLLKQIEFLKAQIENMRQDVRAGTYLIRANKSEDAARMLARTLI